MAPDRLRSGRHGGARYEAGVELTPYKRTPTFDEDTVPAGLLRDHRTRAGVWGRIVVEAGRLRFTDASGSRVLEAGEVAIVAPEQTHAVEPVGQVRFHVEFCTAG